MNSKKEGKETQTKTAPRRAKRPEPTYTAAEKAQAVLAVWTERMRTADVVRATGVTYMTLQQWQDRAMEGMLQALEPRTNLANGSALSPRLRALLAKRQMAAGEGKLKARLEQLQEVAPEGKPSSDP